MAKMIETAHANNIPQDRQISGCNEGEVFRIRLDQKFGSGGEGEVYGVEGRSDLVAKLYYEPPSAEKAEKLLVLYRLGTERLSKLCAWPVNVLLDKPDGKVIGFLMNRIDQAEEVHTLHSPKSRLQRFPEASWAFLVHVAANIARAVAAIHDHGLVIGDLNPKNILVTRRATVYLLDCDSFQVSDNGKTYLCEAGFPEYTPPELQGTAFREIDRKPQHDYFGLAVVIFQLLFLGRHPFSGRFLCSDEMPLERAIKELRFTYGDDADLRQMQQPPGTLRLGAVSAPIEELFRRAFLATSFEHRPPPLEWVDALETLAKSLKKCSLHSGHFYYQELIDCPWCEIELRARVRLFYFALAGADGNRPHFRLNEIWKEIESIEPPDTSLMQQETSPTAIFASPEVARLREQKILRLLVAACFSAISAIGIAQFGPFAESVWFLLFPGIIAYAISDGQILRREPVQLHLIGGQEGSNALPLKQVQAFKMEAENKVRELEHKWDTEVGNDQFFSTKLKELQEQKYTYEHLSQIREEKLRKLQKKSRSNRLDPSWGISPQARIKLDREMDTMRLRLEHELSSGSDALRCWKQRIEESRKELQPALTDARRLLAQAEKDLEVLTKRNPFIVIIFVLIVAFSFGLALRSQANLSTDSNSRSENSSAHSPPTEKKTEKTTSVARTEVNRSSELYVQGNQFSKRGEHKDAVDLFREAIQLDPNFVNAYEELSYSLYCLKRYNESIVAAKQAIRLNSRFTSCYYLGLNYVAQKNWDQARDALQGALAYQDSSSWNEKYTDAYYKLGLSLIRLGEVHETIKELENSLAAPPGLHIERLKLANLYLWTGKYRAANAQYQILRESNQVLAEGLRKLMARHGVRVPRSA